MNTLIINPGKSKTWNGRTFNVYIKIKYENERLSISGVEGPLSSGNCLGSFGQIYDNLTDYTPAHNWTPGMLLQLRDIWTRYHLNDMHSACIHQETRGITYNTHPGDVCPECGYKIGSAWLFQPVPEDVITWLFSLPPSEQRPAWV